MYYIIINLKILFMLWSCSSISKLLFVFIGICCVRPLPMITGHFSFEELSVEYIGTNVDTNDNEQSDCLLLVCAAEISGYVRPTRSMDILQSRSTFNEFGLLDFLVSPRYSRIILIYLFIKFIISVCAM